MNNLEREFLANPSTTDKERLAFAKLSEGRRDSGEVLYEVICNLQDEAHLAEFAQHPNAHVRSDALYYAKTDNIR